MPPSIVTEAAQHLEGKDDRYLMIVSVLLLIAGGAIVIKYLVGHLKHMQERQEVQSERNQERYEKQTEQLMQLVVGCQHSNDDCRAAIRDNTEILRKVKDRMEIFER
jgi:hypothetical protein